MLKKSPDQRFKYTYLALAFSCLILILCVSVYVLQRQSYNGLISYIENNSEKIVDAICYTEVDAILFNDNVSVPESEYDYLAVRIRDTYDSLDILSAVIYDTTHTVVYSNNKNKIGTPNNDPLLIQALSDGEVHSVYKDHQNITDLYAENRENIDIVTVYVPIKSSNDKIIGAFSISSNATKLKLLYNHQFYSSVAILTCSILLLSLVSLMIILSESRELKHAYSLLTKFAITDSLTGLYNRTYYDSELERLASGRRYPVSVIIIDLDGLKKVNDTYGHAAGDKLICKTAEILKQAFRTEDMVARTGGDEFTILMPETGAEGLDLAIDRINSCLEEKNKIDDGFKVKFSFGSEIAETKEKLLGAVKLADMKMYQNKAAHKNSDGQSGNVFVQR